MAPGTLVQGIPTHSSQRYPPIKRDKLLIEKFLAQRDNLKSNVLSFTVLGIKKLTRASKVDILLMEEILHHLGCIKPYE